MSIPPLERQQAPSETPGEGDLRMHLESKADERVQLRVLKAACLVEGTTLLLLVLIAVPLKHFGGWPAGVQVMGPVHGLAFMAYLWIVLQTASGSDWNRADIARMVLLAVLPFGAYVNVAILSRGATKPFADTRR